MGSAFPRQRRLATVLLGGVVLRQGIAPVAAHGGSLGEAARETIAVPTWLFLVTGGAAVGASFLLASFVTDRRLIDSVLDYQRDFRIPSRRLLEGFGRLFGVLGLMAVVVLGLFGPRQGLSNAAVLLVWVGWWAGYTAVTYLFGETWSVLNPWRTIARWLPSLDRPLPDSGAWPGVIGLLGLIWIEVVSPLADAPSLLVTVVLVYTGVTLIGAVYVGSEAYFHRLDPIARVFRYYGQVGPLGNRHPSDRTDGETDRITLGPPGVGLTRADLVTDRSEVAFVIALLWATTYDGFVATPAWRSVAEPLVAVGVPPQLLYPVVLIAGFGLFLSVYRGAARMARTTGNTYVAADVLARRFAPPLVAIAAGYHLAHYLGYFLSLAPALAVALGSPLSSLSTVPVFSLPGWFGAVPVASVLGGHLLAIWITHGIAFDLFPGRLQAIRSQYPFIAVMVLYTMTSLWLVTQPSIQPPFL